MTTSIQRAAVEQWLAARGLVRGAYGRDDVAFAMVPVPGRKSRERVAVTRASWVAFLQGAK